MNYYKKISIQKEMCSGKSIKSSRELENLKSVTTLTAQIWVKTIPLVTAFFKKQKGFYLMW